MIAVAEWLYYLVSLLLLNSFLLNSKLSCKLDVLAKAGATPFLKKSLLSTKVGVSVCVCVCVRPPKA